MLRLVPRKKVKLVHPMGKLWKYTSGWICNTQHGKGFGMEDVGKYYTVYDLTNILPGEYPFEDNWTSFMGMVLSMIPPEVIAKIPRINMLAYLERAYMAFHEDYDERREAQQHLDQTDTTS
eukprot:12422224-Karenia_brevis.AAC.1